MSSYKTYKIGVEQLMIFVITVIVTVSTDLLIGVFSGILAKFIFHILNGAPLRSLFKARYELSENDEGYSIAVKDAAIFSNLIGFKKLFKTIKPGKKVQLNFADAHIVDHTFMEQLHHFEEEYQPRRWQQLPLQDLNIFNFSPITRWRHASILLAKQTKWRSS